VASGTQGRGQEGEERGLFDKQAVEVQADPHRDLEGPTPLPTSASGEEMFSLPA
jgi:hypothetical protein